MSEEKVMNPAAEAEEEEERLHEQVKVRRDKLAALCEAGISWKRFRRFRCLNCIPLRTTHSKSRMTKP